jgi:ribose transport system ATP-binding protein
MSAVHKRFGPTHALRGIDLEVNAGEVVALVGENGAGKSTLMKVLSGAIAPDEGSMQLLGKPYAPRGPLQARRSGVAMIYQELSIAPDLSVMENILLGIEPGAGPLLNRREMRRRAEAALEQLGRPDIDPSARAGELPVAQQQMVEIARSLAIDCRVLVLDEPTSSLGKHDVEALFQLLKRLRDRGLGIVYISHFLEEVRAACDRFVVLRDGASVGSGRIADTRDDEIIRLMVGRDVKELYPKSRRTPGETLLAVTDLSSVRGKPKLASLQLRRGEVLGIAGLVGAGRTEFLRAIFGLDAVTSGKVRVGAFEGLGSPRKRWSQGLGMVSEDRKNEGLALNLSIADNMTLSKLQGLGPAGFVLPSRQAKAAAPHIASLAIKCASPHQPVGDLSGGNQQKVAIGRLLHHECDVLLLDEPTRGIDIGAKARIYTLIDELTTGPNARAVLIVSSYLPELIGLCDRIAVMSRGTLGPARATSDCTELSLMAEATATN